MFERFTERARKVIVHAQNESGLLCHGYVGTEHLLLGLVHEGEGVAAQALTASGVTLESLRGQVETVVGYGEADTSQKPFTPGSKRVLEFSLKEALQLGHNYIGTEHVLLGLVRESEGVAARVLLNLDIDLNAVRHEIIMRLPGVDREVDPMDEVEREMGQEEGARNLFRGRVGGIRTELLLPRPLAVTVDADYAYQTQVELPHSSTTVEPGDVADQIRDGLRETGAWGLETVIAMLDERVLDAFPTVLEVSVTISGAPKPADPPAPTFSVSSTFRR